MTSPQYPGGYVDPVGQLPRTSVRAPSAVPDVQRCKLEIKRLQAEQQRLKTEQQRAAALQRNHEQQMLRQQMREEELYLHQQRELERWQKRVDVEKAKLYDLSTRASLPPQRHYPAQASSLRIEQSRIGGLAPPNYAIAAPPPRTTSVAKKKKSTKAKARATSSSAAARAHVDPMEMMSILDDLRLAMDHTIQEAGESGSAAGEDGSRLHQGDEEEDDEILRNAPPIDEPMSNAAQQLRHSIGEQLVGNTRREVPRTKQIEQQRQPQKVAQVEQRRGAAPPQPHRLSEDWSYQEQIATDHNGQRYGATEPPPHRADFYAQRSYTDMTASRAKTARTNGVPVTTVNSSYNVADFHTNGRAQPRSTPRSASRARQPTGAAVQSSYHADNYYPQPTVSMPRRAPAATTPRRNVSSNPASSSKKKQRRAASGAATGRRRGGDSPSSSEFGELEERYWGYSQKLLDEIAASIR